MILVPESGNNEISRNNGMLQQGAVVGGVDEGFITVAKRCCPYITETNDPCSLVSVVTASKRATERAIADGDEKSPKRLPFAFLEPGCTAKVCVEREP
jgi:hypothetical protein